jgi:prephenate dehydrogenase
MWDAVGADVVDLDAAVHDRIVATSSHLPQMLAFALCAAAGRSADEALLRRLTGGGFRDTTRLALSDPEMWVAIAKLNRSAVLGAMDAFAALWQELRDAVDRQDEAAMRSVMDQARRYKERVG